MNIVRVCVHTIIGKSLKVISKKLFRKNRIFRDHLKIFLKEKNVMENKHKNDSIKCTVKQCQHNMVTENYCSLGCICVGTHESNPTVPECTDCNSFLKRTGV